MQRCAVVRAPPHAAATDVPRCRSLDADVGGDLGPGPDLVAWSSPIPRCCAAYAEQAPYNVVVVELDEDPSIRFVGNVVDGPDDRLDEVDPSTLAIGQPVEVCFAAPVDGIALPRWRRLK